MFPLDEWRIRVERTRKRIRRVAEPGEQHARLLEQRAALVDAPLIALGTQKRLDRLAALRLCQPIVLLCQLHFLLERFLRRGAGSMRYAWIEFT